MANGVVVKPGDKKHCLYFVEIAEPPAAAVPPTERVRSTHLSRPGQRDFKLSLLRAYGFRCAVTECTTTEALEAAHIRVVKGADDNSVRNGILLRRDVHALLDNLLITFSPDGRTLIVSDKLTDKTYEFLRKAQIAVPAPGSEPSSENLKDHRIRFHGREDGQVK